MTTQTIIRVSGCTLVFVWCVVILHDTRFSSKTPPVPFTLLSNLLSDFEASSVESSFVGTFFI